jgi:hypothetical protein
MAFFVSIKFTQKFEKLLSATECGVVFSYLSDYLRKKRAFNISVENNVLSFEAEYDRSNFHLWIPIAGGRISISDQREHSVLIYEISIHQLLITYLTLSLAAGFLFKSILGAILFSITGTFNLIAVFIVHKIRISAIGRGIRTTLAT